jgi:hypothetical protein
MCSVWITEQGATFSLYNIHRLNFINEEEYVYSAVRTESLYKTDMFHLKKIKLSGFANKCIVLIIVYLGSEIK